MMPFKYQIVLAVLVLFFTVGTVHALQISPTSITIPSNSISYFNITFYNNGASGENITLHTSIPTVIYGYYFNSINAYPLSFFMPPGSSKIVLFSFVTNNVFFSTPLQINIPYQENGTNQSFVINAPITPKSSELVSISNITAPNSLYPYQSVNFTARILNGVGSTGVSVPYNYTLSSGSTVVYSSKGTITLNTLGLNVFPFTFKINRSTAPGDYNLNFSVKYTGSFSSGSTSMTVKPFASTQVNSVNNIGAFGGNRSITVTNNGNTPMQASQVAFPVGKFNSLFVAAVTSGRIVNGSIIPSTSLLQPGQTVVLSYTISYLPIYIIIIVIIAAIVGFLIFSRKVKFVKEVVEHRAVDGFIDVKLALRLRNISRTVIKSIEISDVLPPNSLKVSITGQKEGWDYRTIHYTA